LLMSLGAVAALPIALVFFLALYALFGLDLWRSTYWAMTWWLRPERRGKVVEVGSAPPSAAGPAAHPPAARAASLRLSRIFGADRKCERCLPARFPSLSMLPGRCGMRRRRLPLIHPSSSSRLSTSHRQESSFQQLDPGPSVHLPFQQFQLVDVALDAPVAPWVRQRSHHRVHVLLQAPGKAS